MYHTYVRRSSIFGCWEHTGDSQREGQDDNEVDGRDVAEQALAQVNLALVDAMTFADAIDQSKTIPAAFNIYDKKRRRQIQYYQWATRFLTPFFQSNSKTLGAVRDLSMGLSCRIPLVSNLMLSTMCGFQEGLFRSSRQTYPTNSQQ